MLPSRAKTCQTAALHFMFILRHTDMVSDTHRPTLGTNTDCDVTVAVNNSDVLRILELLARAAFSRQSNSYV